MAIQVAKEACADTRQVIVLLEPFTRTADIKTIFFKMDPYDEDPCIFRKDPEPILDNASV